MRSEMKELVDPESNKARALTCVPSGALILTWQVIKSVFGRLVPVEVCEAAVSAEAGVEDEGA